MNKSLIKFVTDFGPLLVFFSIYYNSGKDLKVAIPPFIVATFIAVVIIWFLEKKIPMIPLIGGIFFSKNQTIANATKVATISGGIATDKFLPLL